MYFRMQKKKTNNGGLATSISVKLPHLHFIAETISGLRSGSQAALFNGNKRRNRNTNKMPDKASDKRNNQYNAAFSVL